MPEEYIGISEDRMRHILSVARKCYSLAKERGYDEDTCRRMFMVGYTHDVDYEFATTMSNHADVSEQLLGLMGTEADVTYAVKHHSSYTSMFSPEWEIVSIADLVIDSKGNDVGVHKCLSDIKECYGEKSPQFTTAKGIAKQLGLIAR